MSREQEANCSLKGRDVGWGGDRKVPSTSANMDTVHSRGVEVQMHAPKQSQVFVLSIQLTRGKGKIQSEESHMELTHVWSCPAMPGNPGVWGEDGSWAGEE